MLIITETHGKNYDRLSTYTLKVEREGKKLMSFCASPGEPEDAILERDLSFAYDAITLFQLGYTTGKAGEDVVYRSHTVKAGEEDDENS